ncbi:MAG TPA: hypothetical protein VGR37_07645 [Longimicrobiaceae bacterium]|nr:hypothetical protein [Longimicrobiaceae bacterium]
MPNLRTAALALALAALAACGGEAGQSYPDEEGGLPPGATLQDSLVAGEAIQTTPPLEGIDGADPGTAAGDTMQQAPAGNAPARP